MARCPNRRPRPSGNYPFSRTNRLAADSWTRPRAIRSPCAQLRARSEPALIAAVGLDAGRREWASRLLLERLHDQGRQLQSKAEVGFIALELDDKAGPGPDEYAAVIIQALSSDDPEKPTTSWRNHLVEGSTRLDPRIAALLLATTIEREVDVYNQYQAASALATVASQLEPAEAARICSHPAQVLAIALAAQETDFNTRTYLTNALVEVSVRLGPAEAAQMLASALVQQKDHIAGNPLAYGLSKVSRAVRAGTGRTHRRRGGSALG